MAANLGDREADRPSDPFTVPGLPPIENEDIHNISISLSSDELSVNLGDPKFNFVTVNKLSGLDPIPEDPLICGSSEMSSWAAVNMDNYERLLAEHKSFKGCILEPLSVYVRAGTEDDNLVRKNAIGLIGTDVLSKSVLTNANLNSFPVK